MNEINGWRKLLQLLHQSESIKQLDEVLQSFLTIEERHQLADRVLLISDLLKKEKTQRQIAKDLNISIAKVTRGSNQLKKTPAVLKQYLQRALIEAESP